jgi:hypothetical protein
MVMMMMMMMMMTMMTEMPVEALLLAHGHACHDERRTGHQAAYVAVDDNYDSENDSDDSDDDDDEKHRLVRVKVAVTFRGKA